MPRIRWTPEKSERLCALVDEGYSVHEICERLSEEWGFELTYSQVWERLRNIRKHIKRKPKPLPVELPRCDKFLRLEGDWALVGDLHCPYVDWELALEMTEHARRKRVRQLLICGDVFDFQSLSSYPVVHPPPTPELETSVARAVMGLWGEWFSVIKVLTGNHDLRLFRALQGQVEDESVLALLMQRLDIERNAEWSVYGYCVIETPTGIWRVTHPKNYSRLPLSTAQKLADKHRQHIIMFHGHMTAVGLSASGQHVIASVGCMADPGKLPWVQLVDNTTPAMTQSYALLLDGRICLCDAKGTLYRD